MRGRQHTRASISSLDAVRATRHDNGDGNERLPEHFRDFEELSAIAVENCGFGTEVGAPIRRSADVGKNDLDSLLELIAEMAIEATARRPEVEDAA